MTNMNLKPLKDGEVALTVTYHITDELVNQKLCFIRNESKVRGNYDGISAIYIDDGNRKKPTSTITFSEPGEHIVRIVLEDSTVVPYAIFWHVSNIYSIEIPDTVTKIESGAFDTSIACPPVLPPNLKTIGNSAFDCPYRDFPVLQLPDSVETVGRDNFPGLKHLVVGKNFQGNVKELCHSRWGECNQIEKITIPDDNKYLEVKDGFVIDRATKKLLGILPGTFNDSSDVTIRFPEGISSMDSDIVEYFENVSVVIPGSVEKCELYLGHIYGSNTSIRTISCEEGVKELMIGCNGKVKLSLPDTITKLELRSEMTPIDLQIPKSVTELALKVTMEELHIPSGVKLGDMTGKVNRLYLGQEVTLKEKTWNAHLFDDFQGEVFVEGAVHFDEWGKMKDDSVIHVKDEEIGRKIFNSKDFNKKVKIFIGDNKLLSDQEEGVEDKRIFNLLGVPDLPYHLQPIDSSEVVTLLFNLQEKTQVQIKGGWDYYCYYALDDKPLKRKKVDWRIGLEIVIQKGIHVVRLITSDMSGYDDGPAIEPACEVMLIDDNYSLDSIAKNMKGVKHLVLGARCHIKDVDSLATLPYPKISVVPNNQWLEYRDGCIIERETHKLLLVNHDVTKLPDGILEISSNALRRFNNERLVIPGCSKSVVLTRANKWSSELARYIKDERVDDGLDHVKELVFEEGIEDIELTYCSFGQDVAITFPKTLNKISINHVTAERIRIPVSCNLGTFSDSCIGNLEFLGDVKLQSRFAFSDFSGNISFHGEVSLFRQIDPDEDKIDSFFGKLNDDCTITVSSQAVADAIKSCKDFNPNVKVIVELPAEKKKK